RCLYLITYGADYKETAGLTRAKSCSDSHAAYIAARCGDIVDKWMRSISGIGMPGASAGPESSKPLAIMPRKRGVGSATCVRRTHKSSSLYHAEPLAGLGMSSSATSL